MTPRVLRRLATTTVSMWHGVLLIALLLANGAVGIAWRYVAPGQQFKVFPNGSYVSLPTADYHPFAALALFVLATGAVGLVAAVAIWRVRAVRGVATLWYLTAFSALCSLGAAAAAGLFRQPGSPSVFAEAGGDVIATSAPQLTTPLAIVAEPLVAALAYTFLVAWDGRPGLGRNGRDAQALG